MTLVFVLIVSVIVAVAGHLPRMVGQIAPLPLLPEFVQFLLQKLLSRGIIALDDIVML
jgi:hypothetical protein